MAMTSSGTVPPLKGCRDECRHARKLRWHETHQWLYGGSNLPSSP